jgi:hypothetical protein
MQAWETKTRHSSCSIRPTETGPTTWLPTWRPTLAWIASAPTRALGNSIGASDYLSDASGRLRPSVGCGLWASERAFEPAPGCCRRSGTTPLSFRILAIMPSTSEAASKFRYSYRDQFAPLSNSEIASHARYPCRGPLINPPVQRILDVRGRAKSR